MDKWTVEMVEDRLVEAASVIRRLPPVRVPGYFNTWPPMIVEFADRVSQEPEPMRLPPPAPSAIGRMEEALTWLRWLEVDNVKLVWARLNRTPWKAICWQFGLSRATANRRWQYGLSVIAWRLNGRKPPTKGRARSIEGTYKVRALDGRSARPAGNSRIRSNGNRRPTTRTCAALDQKPNTDQVSAIGR